MPFFLDSRNNGTLRSALLGSPIIRKFLETKEVITKIKFTPQVMKAIDTEIQRQIGGFRSATAWVPGFREPALKETFAFVYLCKHEIG